MFVRKWSMTWRRKEKTKGFLFQLNCCARDSPRAGQYIWLPTSANYSLLQIVHWLPGKAWGFDGDLKITNRNMRSMQGIKEGAPGG